MMIIKLSDRAEDAKRAMIEARQELDDYNLIVSLVKAFQLANTEPEKHKFTQEEYDKCYAKLQNLCAKHEIRLPDYIDWSEDIKFE